MKETISTFRKEELHYFKPTDILANFINNLSYPFAKIDKDIKFNEVNYMVQVSDWLSNSKAFAIKIELNKFLNYDDLIVFQKEAEKQIEGKEGCFWPEIKNNNPLQTTYILINVDNNDDFEVLNKMYYKDQQEEFHKTKNPN